MRCVHFFVLLIPIIPLSGQGITFEESLALVRKHAPEAGEFQKSLEKIEAQADALEAAFDGEFAADADFTRDAFKSQTNPWDKAQVSQYGVSFGKMIQSGGRYSVALSHEQKKLTFPEFVRSPASPVGPEDSFSINPEFESRISLTFMQPLFRNLWAREVRIRQEIVKGSGIGPVYGRAISMQAVQAETEQLFITLAGYREKMELTSEMKDLSTKFYRLMVSRESFGRAEKLDIAEAKSREVETDGLLLQLKIAAGQAERRLKYRVYGVTPPQNVSFETPEIRKPLLKIPADTFEGLADFALKNRLDLEMLEKNKGIVNLSLDLAREENRSDLSFFTSLSYNGLEDSAGKSFSKATHPRLVAGLQLRVTVGGSRLRAVGAETVAANSELTEKAAVIRFQINRDIEVSLAHLASAHKLLEQSSLHQETLKNMLREERKRISQARSDEIAAIRYEIDVLRARLEEITALEQARSSEASLRFLCHGYKREAS